MYKLSNCILMLLSVFVIVIVHSFSHLVVNKRIKMRYLPYFFTLVLVRVRIWCKKIVNLKLSSFLQKKL